MQDHEAQLIHDMRNTALVLRGAAQQLHEHDESLPPAMRANLTAMLVRRSDMLGRLLADLTTSHQVERGDLALSLQPVSLATLCRDALEGGDLPGDTQVVLDLHDNAVALADPLRVTQVLDNLVTNALRYGGAQVRVSATRAGSVVHLAVSDDGPGVPDDLVDTLFDAYVRGASSPGLGGSGLGLLIARQLCEAMGGSVSYTHDGGARFTATFAALPTSDAPVTGRDVAYVGHSVAFWTVSDCMARDLTTYVAHGLVAGEAVVVAATPAHHDLLQAGLTALGIDPHGAIASGQYVALDADELHRDLAPRDNIDPERFATLIEAPVRAVSRRWRTVRVYGESVDLYSRRGDDHLALELEACWNELRRDVSFPLLCAYELAPDEVIPSFCDCHDAVVAI
ncbi:hypothetical protein NPS01_39370 [Nocardioides psychrotolerans]|uniref:histidine kinase n=1 Tax=Nocardioides psychrotolerans TaxID=1005945 RepID=A0A1I3QYX2_9ACTN|nr:ATP-binding protein [Nocardioides psychrotolerans]GEP40274.1 hypothetical protein NPS01_39370 [Nocardioides psychrotolerans]SFJ38296.1 MEDS: MEthanogen/methylotroph, DcmR Sensory domain [Nocardioides psychrotolerans]